MFDPIAQDIARVMLAGFDRHYRLFRQLSIDARSLWAAGDWGALRESVRRRIDMYDERVREAVDAIRAKHPEAGRSDAVFRAVKPIYIGMIYDHKQPECAETFFNSVATRLLATTYHQNDCIFSRPAISTEHIVGEHPTYRCYYPSTTDLRETLAQVLTNLDLGLPFEDLDRDTQRLHQAIKDHFPKGWTRDVGFQIQVLWSPFYRGRACYVVGRALRRSAVIPFVIPLRRSDDAQIYVDTLLLDTKAVGQLLSLARDYFLVDMDVPSAYVAFLETLVPRRPRSDFYTLVGLQKQGKTLLVRDMNWHLGHSSDQFSIAPGVRGMVMLVFTLPSFPYVFKVIRDWFEAPKDADRRLVEQRYNLVKHHDRAGRMADSLEFVDVALPRARFDEGLLAEMRRLAPSVVEITDEQVIIHHMYIERRLTPLDIYLAESDEAHVRQAIDEFGEAIKDLARANIFPGDMMLKNFGVNRFGRVVFYDYDEICYLTDCCFRALPRSRDDDEELSSEPWFTVGPNDVFPEQFPAFLLPPGLPRNTFLELHGDLATPGFWASIQAEIRAGVMTESWPYSHRVRFPRATPRTEVENGSPRNHN